MIEIVFSEGAAGSMKVAKSAKNIPLSSTAVILRDPDGSFPTPEELARKQAQVEEEYRRKWENSVPMEGDDRDVACFPLNLSMGDISAPFSDERAEFLQSLVMIAGDGFETVGREMMRTARNGLEMLRSTAGPFRIWTSQNSDEFCGFCHVMTLLPKEADIRVVELPAYTVAGNELHTWTSWAEVEPTEFGRLQALERPLTDAERCRAIGIWQELQAENGPLRASINARLCTVGADFYDSFILRELERAPMEPEWFHEARLIGRILGKYPLGLSDWFVAKRMEEFISRGMLIPATAPAEGSPIYHRYLKRVRKGKPVTCYDWRFLHVGHDLKRKEINPTDGEEIGYYAPNLDHCAFCRTRVQYTRRQRWFVPTDLSCCICEECFYDFREMFQWRELDGWDIKWNEEE